MNQDEIIAMAKEARISEMGLNIEGSSYLLGLFERFAALVAAAERRKHQTDIEAWKAEAATAEKWRGMALDKDPMHPGKVVQEIQREAVEREREACAQVAEWTQCLTSAPDRIAAAIRARSQQ